MGTVVLARLLSLTCMYSFLRKQVDFGEVRESQGDIVAMVLDEEALRRAQGMGCSALKQPDGAHE